MERLAQEAYNRAIAVNNGSGAVSSVTVHQERLRYYIRSYIHRILGKTLLVMLHEVLALS